MGSRVRSLSRFPSYPHPLALSLGTSELFRALLAGTPAPAPDASTPSALPTELPPRPNPGKSVEGSLARALRIC